MNARDLSNQLAVLLRKEQGAMADFLVGLANFDRQRVWRELGHATLFAFLRCELGLSAGAAQYRKTAAELVQRFPEVEAALREGRLCLSSITELAKVITEENAPDILSRFYGLSRREAADVAVSIRPVVNPPMREVITAVPPAAGMAMTFQIEQRLGGNDEAAFLFQPAEAAPESSATTPVAMHLPASTAAEPRRSTVEPLDAELARLHLTVSRRVLAKLEAAKDALSHARPRASTEEVLEACLDLMLAHHAKRKGLVEKPRKTARPVTSGAIPAAVKREAWKRAGGRCEWKLDSGGVCGSTVRLEFDHVTPRALGGASTIDNVRVLCCSHNQLAARLAFGDAWMDRFARRGRSKDAPPRGGAATAAQLTPAPPPPG